MLYIKLRISCQADVSFEHNSILLPSTRKSASRIACSACARNQFRRAIVRGGRYSIRAQADSRSRRSAWQLWKVCAVRSVRDITANQKHERSNVRAHHSRGKSSASRDSLGVEKRSPPVRSGYSDSSLVERNTPLVRWHFIRRWYTTHRSAGT